MGVASSKPYSDCSVCTLNKGSLPTPDFSVAAADFSVLTWLVGVASSKSYSDRSVFAPDFSVLALLVGVASSKFETCSDCSVFALLAADFSVAAADFSVLAWLVGVASSNSYSDRSVFAPGFSVLALLVGVASSKFETCSDCSVFALLAADFSVAAADFSVLAWLVGVASSNSYSDRSVFAPDFSVLALLVGVASSKFETCSDCSVFALLAADFSVAAADFSVLAWLVGVASSKSYSDRSVFAPDFSVLALLVGVASSKFETYSDCSVFALLAADFSVAAADFSVLAWLVGVASSNSYSDRSVFAPDFSVLALLVGVESSKFETYSDCSVFALLAADFSVAAADFSVLAWLVGVASSNSYSDRSVFAPDFSVLALLVGVASSKFETYSDCSVFALLAPDFSVAAADFSVLAWLVGVASSKSYSDGSVFASDFSVLALLVGVTSSKFETYSDCSVFALLAADLPDLSVLAWLVGVADVPDLGDLQERHLSRARGWPQLWQNYATELDKRVHLAVSGHPLVIICDNGKSTADGPDFPFKPPLSSGIYRHKFSSIPSWEIPFFRLQWHLQNWLWKITLWNRKIIEVNGIYGFHSAHKLPEFFMIEIPNWKWMTIPQPLFQHVTFLISLDLHTRLFFPLKCTLYENVYDIVYLYNCSWIQSQLHQEQETIYETNIWSDWSGFNVRLLKKCCWQ